MNKASATFGQKSSDWKDGDHFIFWYKTADGRANAIAEFLDSGKRGGALMTVILPLRELEETEFHLRKLGFPVDGLMEEGRLLLFASEELLPLTPLDCQKIGVAFVDLLSRAEKKGYRLILAGRVAPVLLEHGEVEKAIAVELTADSTVGKARLLCLYDESNLKGLDKNDINMINDMHSQRFHEADGGKMESPKRRRNAKTARSVKRKDR